MKISIFTIADYITEQSGKLTIVGVFDSWQSSKFPFRTSPFGIAIKGYIEDSDYGKDKTFTIELKPQGKKGRILKVDGEIKYAPKKTKNINAIVFSFKIPSIEFNKPGVYVLEYKIGKKVHKSLLVEVINTAASPDSTKKTTKKTKKKTKK